MLMMAVAATSMAACSDDDDKKVATSDIVGRYAGSIDVTIGTTIQFPNTGWAITTTTSADTFKVTTDTLNVQGQNLVINLKASEAEVVIGSNGEQVDFRIPAQTTLTAVGLLSITSGHGIYLPSTGKMTIDAGGTMNMGTAISFSVSLDGNKNK